MDLITAPAHMREWTRARRLDGERVGVVPTMGALHRGHLALVEAVRERADRVVVTIFVNPLQFNQSTDFDHYPRPIDADLDTCRGAGVDAVYAPTAATMYPSGFQTHVEPGDLADRLEGPMRPGHFRGVTTVVTKLLNATLPDVAAFGQKDFQQLAIVRRMVRDLDLAVEILGVPIVREHDGIALSSRNVRLGPDDRQAALVISRSLRAAADAFDAGERDAATIRSIVLDGIAAEPRADVEYVEVVDAMNLDPVERAEPPVCVLTAAWFGDVRLIDNVLLDA
ncbi:MAG: pantoate--beta-alanine ligase [Ilumatobacteraceae bacterium]|nr:pantoate--beta-alanine ligase [Ilumatobacteraceae bacterium]